MDSISFKTISANSATVDKKWVIVDAEGQVLGRLASRIAFILRGKHKTNFTPHVDCGDNVIVINAAKVRFTGKKMDDKEYIHHTGYPGGQRVTTPRRQFAKDATKIVEWAVKGMLPKTKLGDKLFTNLRVYPGDVHPHAAQEPVTLEIL
ncbi:MAG: 50S ribosomal protein L13 [Bacteroidia bacterium]|nr:50S ribosomal protein L13 [Bacteroidia bacterium]